MACLRLLQRVSQPAGAACKREERERRMRRQIESGSENRQREIDVRALTHRFLHARGKLRVKRRYAHGAEQGTRPGIAIGVKRMAECWKHPALREPVAHGRFRANAGCQLDQCTNGRRRASMQRPGERGKARQHPRR